MEIYPNTSIENMIDEIEHCLDDLESYIPDSWPYAQKMKDMIMDWRNGINAIEEESEIIISASDLERVPPLPYSINESGVLDNLRQVNLMCEVMGCDDYRPSFLKKSIHI